MEVLMNIVVLTPDQEIFRGKITSVKVPGTSGQFQVLKGHAPIVSSLDSGAIELVTAKGEYRVYNDETGVIETEDVPGRKIRYEVSGGFIEVLNDEISLLIQGLKSKNNKA